MSAIGPSRAAGESGGRSAEEVAPQSPEPRRPVLVHSCSRLGRRANPPGYRLSFTDWFRPGRRDWSEGSAPPDFAHDEHRDDSAQSGQ